MSRKGLFACLIVLVILGSVFAGGCAGEKTTAPANGDSKETPAVSAEVVELNFATWHHPNYPLNTEVWEPFCQEVEEKTEGRVKIYFHPGSVLLKGMKPMMLWSRERLTWVYTAILYYWRFPLTGILEFPFMFTTQTGMSCNSGALKLMLPSRRNMAM